MTEARGADSEERHSDHVSTGVGMPFAAVFTVVALAALLTTALSLNRIGVASRSVLPARERVIVVNNAKDLRGTWDTQGVHGAWLVDVTNNTAFVYPRTVEMAMVAYRWPFETSDLLGLLEESVGRGNVNRVAAQTGVFRSITYVFEPSDLAVKIEAGRKEALRGIASDGRSVNANDDGYLRLLTDRFPSVVHQPAVLNIDASYFVKGSPETLMAQLERSDVDFQLVTLNRALDATNVPEPARASLDRAAKLLQVRIDQR